MTISENYSDLFDLINSSNDDIVCLNGDDDMPVLPHKHPPKKVC